MASLRARMSAFFMFALFFLMSTVVAQEQPDIVAPVGDKKITISGTIVAIVLMVAGFLFAFFGHRFFRITLFLAGFYVLSTLAWIALANIEPKEGWGNREWIYLGVAGAAGIIGGALFLCFWRLGFAAIGAMAGFYLAVFILSWKESGVITQSVPRTIFIVIFVIIGIIVTFFIERHVVIIGTAIVGSGSFFLGLDNFVKTGFSNALNAFLDGKHPSGYELNAKVYGMLGGTLAMIIVGTCFQYYKHRGTFIPKSHRDQAPKYHSPSYNQV
ncbi:hypothetical protein BGW41_005889 [Actinomortierella wolfii]|nr:hypothetical protein BGW41_005889 [Actinomortierella wolfii]